MRRPRLKLLLPVLNVVIAIVLFHLARLQMKAVSGFYDSPYVPTATMALDGLNAPVRIPVVIVRNLLGSVPLTSTDHPSFTSDLDKVGYLCCIFTLWYFVGREFDNSRPLQLQLADPSRNRSLLWNITLLFLGIYLTVFSILNFARVQDLALWNNFVGNAIEGLLFWSWSLVLLITPCRRIVSSIRALRSDIE